MPILRIISEEPPSSSNLDRVDSILPEVRFDEVLPEPRTDQESKTKHVEHADPPLPLDDCPMTPPNPTSNEGYDHRVSIDSILVTPHVHVLVEDMTNARTIEEHEVNNDSLAQPMGFDPYAPFKLEPMKRLKDGCVTSLLMG